MSDIPAGAVTTADLYRELVGMRQDVVRALERLAAVDARNVKADTTHADHEARLRSLERFRFTLLGAAAGCSALASTLGTVIGVALTHH